MRQRSISAVGVVLAVLVPALFGGPIWAIAVLAFATIGLSEFYSLGRALSIETPLVGYLAIPLAVTVAYFDWRRELVLLPFAVVMLGSLIMTLGRKTPRVR